MDLMTQLSSARDSTSVLPFQAVFEGAAVGIAICRLDGSILDANPALSRMLGYSQDELISTHAYELYPEPCRPANDANGHESSRDERQLAELLRGERPALEIEQRYYRKDGSVFWGHLTLSLGRDALGHGAFLIAMLADATGRKQMEEHLREAEKMEVIGRLAGGIAHDFNNLLTGILLYCDLLSAGLEKMGSPTPRLPARGLQENHLQKRHPQNASENQLESASEELIQHVEEVRRAGEQGAAVTQQLLAIARKQRPEPRPVPLHETVSLTENLLRRLIGEQIHLAILSDSRLDASCGLVLADPAQLRQILLNLVLNARDAMPEGGKITVSTRTAEFPEALPRHGGDGPRLRARRRAVALVVTDNGCGMTSETLARLFEPFFTTKKPGDGTGLGLATVQRIVSESGGSIKVNSELGRGTAIEVLFPAVEPLAPILPINVLPINALPTDALPIPQAAAAATSTTTTPSQNSIPESRRKTILLVDDHLSTRKSMWCLLHEAGYRMLEASSPVQALELFAGHSCLPDLLIAECVLPGMTGPELAEALLKKKPDLKILFVSGFPDGAAGPFAGAGSFAGKLDLIRKPFSGKALIARVIEVMHRQAS